MEMIQTIINTGLFVAILFLIYALWELSNQVIMLKAQVKINSMYVMKRIK